MGSSMTGARLGHAVVHPSGSPDSASKMMLARANCLAGVAQQQQVCANTCQGFRK